MPRTAPVMVLLLLTAVSSLGQQPASRPTPLVGMRPTAKPEMLEIYQIDLVPSGSAFAVNKPVLEGDAYVFKVWPEKQIVHLPKTRVRNITQRTKALEQFSVYQIDLVPSGRMLAKDNPTLKNKSYAFHTWKDNKLMTLRQADVKQVRFLQGLPAFKAQQEEKGAALIGNLPMEGGGSVTFFNEPPPEPANPAAGPASTTNPNTGNWNYHGVPGATDAYAPANAVVDRPGDPPKAPTPRS